MKFVPKSSLEHMALLKIVISLWNQNDIRALIARLCFSKYFLHRNAQWKYIENRVIAKVPNLLLPQLLKDKLLCFIKPIGLQLFEWVEFHCISLNDSVNLPTELCWTSQGTVDRKKTAEMLVKDDNLDLSTRYKLACIYCLEDYIHKFWSNMSEDLKESFPYESQIIIFWSHIMKRRGLENAHTSYWSEFYQSAAFRGNKVQAEYFLRKLTPQAREEDLVKTAKNVIDTHTLCFLLSEMDEVQQLEVFKNDPCRVLRCFLQWPFQSFFIGIANCMWNFLSKKDYYNILTVIIFKVRDGYKDCNYQELFREFWQESPDSLKSFITDNIDKGNLLPSLFRIKDKENMRLILKDTTLAVKDKLIFSEIGNTFCESFIRNNEWDFLEYFIQECLPSKNKMLKFKEEFEKHMMRPRLIGHFAIKKQKWDELFRLADDPILKNDKRSLEEGESSSSKRFRSLQ